MSKKQKDAAQEAARHFFSLLLDKDQAPAIWGDASFDASNELIYILESNFPWIHLCDNHWKATMIATNSYSQWYPKALQRRSDALAKKATNAKVIDVDTNNNNGGKLPKRSWAEDNGMRGSKRPHVEEIQPTPHPNATKITTKRGCVCKTIHSNYMRH